MVTWTEGEANPGFASVFGSFSLDNNDQVFLYQMLMGQMPEFLWMLDFTVDGIEESDTDVTDALTTNQPPSIAAFT